MSTTTSRAAIYIRVSTDEQAEARNGLHAQEDSARDCAKRESWEVGGVFPDEGVSGSEGLARRPGLLAAIATLRKGDVLLVAKRDRIGRLGPLEMAMIESAVRRRGARIVSAAGEGTDDDDPASVLMRRMIDAFSEYELLVIGARTKDALTAKRKRGEKLGGAVPYGSERGPDKPGGSKGPIKTIVPCAAELVVLALMRELRASGMSLEAIGTELSLRGIQRREGGTAWDHGYISRLLRQAAHAA